MGIFKFVLRRLLFGVLTMFIVSTVVFVLTQGLRDPAQAILGKDAFGPQGAIQLAAKRKLLNLDRPVVNQYFSWLWDMIWHHRFPKAFSGSRPSMLEFYSFNMKNSLFLMFVASVVSIPLSIVVGAVAARRRDKGFDSATSGINLILAGTPEYVIGFALLFLFSLNVFHLFPGGVRIRPGEQPWVNLKQLVLPVATLSLAVIPYVSRTMRASMIEVLESDYVEMARLKGVSEGTVLWRHALPNAIGPTLQVVAINIAYLVAGVITVEVLFNFPGVGIKMRDAVIGHDAAAVQFLSIFVSGIYVVVNLLADIGTILATPRLRTSFT
ncbi:MAG: ABC transporter permease [Ilumatobacteraceae bacterium]